MILLFESIKACMKLKMTIGKLLVTMQLAFLLFVKLLPTVQSS